MTDYDSGWISRLRSEIKRSGYGNALQMSNELRDRTYKEIASHLGGGVSPAQIEMLMCRDAIQAGENTKFQRESLFRYLRACVTSGWKYGEDPIPFSLAKAVSGWARLARDLEGPFGEVIRRIQSREIVPEGWAPTGPEDEVMNELFSAVFFSENDYSLIANEDWMA